MTTMANPTRTALGLALVVTAACDGGLDGASGGAFGERTLTLEGPLARIGAVDDPDYAFGTVVDLAVGGDGTVYSVHRDDAHVRLWTPDGEPAGTIGGEGQGPGEFTRPGLLGFFGDTLWVMDTYAYRVSYFDTSGTFLGSVIPEVDIGGPDEETEWSPPRPRTPLPDGTFIGQAPAWSRDIAEGTLTGTPFVHLDGDGGTLGRIWMQSWQPGDILALLEEDGSGGFFLQQPFGDDPVTATDADGLVVVDRRVWDGEGPAVVGVTRIALTGDTVWSTSIPYEPAVLAAERVDSAVAAMAARTFAFRSRGRPGLSLGAYERDIAEETYAPGWAPAVRSAVFAENGSLWLERFDPVPADEGGTLRAWWILGAAGQPVGEAFTPDGLEVLTITDDAVWGVETDELDVNYIVRYRLVDSGAT